MHFLSLYNSCSFAPITIKWRNNFQTWNFGIILVKMNDKKIVLVIGMGTSPAVMTETVWALAHQAEPVVPDEIVVITTKSGKDTLRAAIMSGAPSVWNRLKNALAKEKIAIDGKLVFGDTSIRVIPDAEGNEASDLRTGADNLSAADFMLTPIQAKHSQRPIVSGSMRHAFLFADESENGCIQPLFLRPAHESKRMEPRCAAQLPLDGFLWVGG